MKLSAKSAFVCAVLPLGLLLSGCGGIGDAGMHNVVAGNWPAAQKDFDEDYSNHPDHPIAVFNMGASYHHDGNIDKADAMFGEAVENGKDYHADETLEPGGRLTVADQACNRLHRDNKLDANCGDHIVAMVVPAAPPPAIVAEAAPEPAPAVEAEATMAPKQDRN